MAIKDQCLQCAHFNSGICDIGNTLPNYNQMSCETYRKTGIDLEKHEKTENNTVTISNDEPNVQGEKQGMFSHPFSFKGRIRRLEYGISYIIYMAWELLFTAGTQKDSSGTVFLVVMIPALWFLLAQGAKRCHDRDNSGWYQIIPFYGLWMLFGDGDAYENSYGPDPKGRNMLS